VYGRAWLAVLGVAAAFALPARSELYRWVDESGGVHVTEDISEVPPEQRPRADQEAVVRELRPARWGKVEDSLPAAPAKAQRRDAGPKRATLHHLAIARAGNEIRIDVEIDGGLAVPFIADTGASMNTIPRWAVEQLGLDVPRDAPVMSVAGVSGQAMRVPLIRIASVRVGTAVVEDVEMAVIETMNTGLLGMPFFNHFKTQIDPVAGIMTLEEIPAGAIDSAFGGYDESMWRRQYAQIRREQARLDRLIEQVPSSYTSIIEKLESERSYWDDQLDQLEDRAQKAGVPQSWRD
jgi:clan AA aspartic protease (TIGR02281 family)